MLMRRQTYRPSRDLITESVRVGLPLDTKEALAQAARRAGKPVSLLVREAIGDVIADASRSKSAGAR